MKKRIIIFLILFVVLLFGMVFFFSSIGKKRTQPIYLNPYLTINNAKVNLAIADTPDKQIQGLSGQASLEKNSGMLFIFSGEVVRSFWMKDMNFPLDIVWIAGNKVVKIDANLPPAGEQPQKSYSSILPIDHVLEVNAGFCENEHIHVGDDVKYFLQQQ